MITIKTLIQALELANTLGFGEFGYDKDKDKWTEVVQDVDGKMYNVEW